MTETKPPEVLSIGAIVGGITAEPQRLGDLAMALARRVGAALEGVESPVCVNVVYLIPGELVPAAEFEGVRAARYSRKRGLLLVQAAIPEGDIENPDKLLLDLLADAIEEAAAYVRKKKLAPDLPELRALAERVTREAASGLDDGFVMPEPNWKKYYK